MGSSARVYQPAADASSFAAGSPDTGSPRKMISYSGLFVADGLNLQRDAHGVRDHEAARR